MFYRITILQILLSGWASLVNASLLNAGNATNIVATRTMIVTTLVPSFATLEVVGSSGVSFNPVQTGIHGNSSFTSNYTLNSTSPLFPQLGVKPWKKWVLNCTSHHGNDTFGQLQSNITLALINLRRNPTEYYFTGTNRWCPKHWCEFDTNTLISLCISDVNGHVPGLRPNDITTEQAIDAVYLLNDAIREESSGQWSWQSLGPSKGKYLFSGSIKVHEGWDVRVSSANVSETERSCSKWIETNRAKHIGRKTSLPKLILVCREHPPLNTSKLGLTIPQIKALKARIQDGSLKPIQNIGQNLVYNATAPNNSCDTESKAVLLLDGKETTTSATTRAVLALDHIIDRLLLAEWGIQICNSADKYKNENVTALERRYGGQLYYEALAHSRFEDKRSYLSHWTKTCEEFE